MRDQKTEIPGASSTIRAQLEEFRAASKAARDYGPRDFASRLALQAIDQHEAELIEELHAADMLESHATANATATGTG